MKDTIFFILIGVCVVVFGMFGIIFLFYPPKPQPSKAIQSSVESKNIIANKTPLTVQFTEQGFTADEAKILEEQFNTMGIKQIDNLTKMFGNGIDNLQSFNCTIYDYSTLTFNFTIENRKLCYAELSGIPTEKMDYAYINIFGDVKIKTKNTVKSITFYDVWDENGEVIEDAIGYKAVFDYENKLIKEYVGN